MASSENPRKVVSTNSKRRRMILMGGGGAALLATALVGAFVLMGRGNDCAFGALEAFAFGGTRNADSAPDYVYRLCTTSAGGVSDGVFEGWALRTGVKTLSGRVADGTFSGTVIAGQSAPVTVVKGKLADFVDMPALDYPDPITGAVRSLDCPGGTYSYRQTTQNGFFAYAECRFVDVTSTLGLHPEGNQWIAAIEKFEFVDGGSTVTTSAFLSWFDKDTRGSLFEKKLKTSPTGLDVKNGLHARGAKLYRARVLP